MKYFLFVFCFLFLISFQVFSQSQEGFVKTENGCLVWTINNAYKIQWSGDCLNGYAVGNGTKTTYDEKGVLISTFKGTLVSGKRVEGTCMWQDGTMYTGPFTDDLPTGLGRLEYYNSNKEKITYVGYVEKRLRHGKGTTYLNNSIINEGIYEDDKFTKGTTKTLDGNTYVGTFNQKDGSYLEGNYVFSNGNEIYFFADGKRRYRFHYDSNWLGCSKNKADYYIIVLYLGEYEPNKKPIGEIRFYYMNGKVQSIVESAEHIDFTNEPKSIYSGTTTWWDADEKFEQRETISKGYYKTRGGKDYKTKIEWADGSIFEGTHNGYSIKYGKLKWANGTIFEGTYDSDNAPKYGKYTYPSGTTFTTFGCSICNDKGSYSTYGCTYCGGPPPLWKYGQVRRMCNAEGHKRDR